MNVVFSCVTNYTIFISYILIKTVYQNDCNILVADDALVSEDTINKIRKVGVWDEVIYSKDINYNEVIKGFESREIHVFNMYNIEFSKHIFKILFHKNVEFNLIEEGTATWNLDFFFDYHVKDISQELTKDQIKRRISKIFALDKNLIESKSNFIIKNIEIDDIINNPNIRQSYLKDLNYIFEYVNENINSNVIYFDNNLSQAFIASRSDDIYLNNIVIETFNKLLIKPHPNDYKYKYTNIDEDIIIKNKNVPWEIIYLNNIEKIENLNLLYVSIVSTSIFLTKILNKKSKIKSVFLHSLVKNACSTKFNNEIRDYKYKEIIEKYNRIYGETVYIPDTIEEYVEILKKVDMKFDEDVLKKYSIYLEHVEGWNNRLNNHDFIFIRTMYWFKKIFIESEIRVCLWGTGGVAQKTLDKMKEWDLDFKLISVIDNFKEGNYKGIPISTQEEIENLEYDIILICTSISKVEVEGVLINKGLEYGKDFVYGYSI